MQGVALLPENPQQGSPPPNNSLVTTDMEISPNPASTNNSKSADIDTHTDSGIFSTTTNTTSTSLEPTDISTHSNNHSEDNRSDCSSPERKYNCPICEAMLTSQHEFTLHIRSHHNETESSQDSTTGFTCRICKKVLSSSSSLDRHVLVHSGERPFHCKHCGDTFTTNGNMHRHMRTHNHNKSENYESDGSVDSSTSGSSKSTEYNNNKVEKNNNKRKLLEDSGCVNVEQICKKEKLDEDSVCDNQYFKCPVCERGDFNSMTNLEMHLGDNHPEYPAKCSQCKQVFPNNKQLSLHKSTVHSDSPCNKQQPVVGFKDLTFVDFSSEKFPIIARKECEMNLHKVGPTAGLKFQCRRCCRAFPCSNSLEIHESDCVTVDGIDLSKSKNMSENDIRRIEFFTRLNLQDNSPEKSARSSPLLPETPTKLREHLTAKFNMDNNTRDLADIHSILNNINLQQGKPAALSSKINFEMSAMDNKNEQEEESQDLFAVEFRKMKLRGEFPCRLCTAVFPNLRALKGHNRAHLNGNNNGTYYCNMCPHSSIDKAALIRHMRTHNGDRPYECSLCNYAFTTKANCERHLRNRHAKSTREEVKKAIIYHPSEDPTNEDLNKLNMEDKKLNISSSTDGDLSPEKLHSSTPKVIVDKNELLKPSMPLIPDLQALKPNIFPNINDIIRNENLRSLKENKLFKNGLPIPLPFAAVPPTSPAKIQVKNLDTLKMHRSYSDDECDDEPEVEEPMDLVLDLSKKKRDNSPSSRSSAPFEDDDIDEAPQDLTKKSPVPPAAAAALPFNMGDIFAQQFLKQPPKIDPTALYASHIARLYQNGFANWNGFPINPLLFPAIPAPIAQNPQELKERMQRQLCGGTLIAEDLKAFQSLQQQQFRNAAAAGYGYKLDKPDEYVNSIMNNVPKKEEINKPLSLNVDSNSYNENLIKLQSPHSNNKADVISPNSVKMVIKNGVLMPKQKQRRYRTERPFTCEHCSARFTLRSNMERHIKQQHPQFWSQRQRGNVGNPGRKSQAFNPTKNFCDLSIPNLIPKNNNIEMEDAKKEMNEKLKLAILAQQFRTHQQQQLQQQNVDIKKEEDDECDLVIDENEDSNKKTEFVERPYKTSILENKLTADKNEKVKSEEDLVSVSKLLDNASQQQFKEYFKRDAEEHEGLGDGISEEDEEGLVASGSTSEENISGTDENRSESDTAAPVKKKSAYSLAPNRVSCPYCSRKFPWTSSLRRHILTHTGQKPFKCSHCPLLFTTKSNCDRHLLRKHGNNASTVTNESSNSNFLIRNVPERPFKCSTCPSSTFSTYSNLKKHISCKHSTNAQGDDIKAQGYEAGSSEDEKMPSVDVIKPIKLDIVKAKLERENCSNNNSIQNNSDSLPFKCHLCEGSFSERQDALDHIRDYHASEYDLLMSKNALDYNATTPDDASHQDDDDIEIRGKFPDYSNRKVICAFCMRRFWSAEDLRRHMRTHTGERPFSCDICRRRFTLKHSMLRHRKKHNNMNFENENSDEDGNLPTQSPPMTQATAAAVALDNSTQKNNNKNVKSEKTDESDNNEGGGDLISNLLGLRDKFIIDKVLAASADDAAKLLGLNNGSKE